MLFAIRRPAVIVSVFAIVAVTFLIVAVAPDQAEAALRSAAGGGDGGGGFAKLGAYMSRLASYLIALAVPLAVLGTIYGGALFISGSPKAGQVLGYVVVGFILVVASKGLAA